MFPILLALASAGRRFKASIIILTFLAISPFFAGCQPSVVPQPTEQRSVPEAEPSLSMASSTVLQNGEFRLSVDGFVPGETVFFRVGDETTASFKEIGRTKADLEGRVRELALKLPKWITSGARTLEVQGESSGRRVESVFYVRAEKPWTNLGSYAVKQDASLGLAAGGFAPGENVSLFFEQNPQTVLASATADLAGNIEWVELALRGFQAGQYNLILFGETSQIKITEPIVVSPRAPWIRLHVYTIGPGGSIGLDGHDFAPGERVQAYLDEPTGQPLADVKADEAGNFTVDNMYVAKPGDVGRHRVIAIGELTTGNTMVGFDVIPFTPAFQMTVYSGPPGTEVSFNGRGFAPGETVRVFMQGQEQPMATIAVDSFGGFADAGRFMVPRNANGGNLGMTLIGEASGVRLTQNFSVIRIQPFLGLDRYAGPAGTVVRFRGLGFAAGENVIIYLSNRQGPRAATATAGLDGKFETSTPFTVPGDSSQDVVFTAVGEASGTEATVRFQVLQRAPDR